MVGTGVNVGGLLVSLPVYIVWIAGIVIAAIRWSRYPRTSLLAISGLVILLVQDVLTTLLVPWVQITVLRGGVGIARLGFILSVINVVANLIRASGWVLVLAALFTRRDAQPISD